MRFRDFELTTTQILLVPLEMSLDVSELLKQIVVLENLDVLHVEVSFVVALELLVRLAWVNSLQDAELSEVLQI